MASIKVTYTQTRTLTQTIDWPSDEMGDFNRENLECNLEPDDAQEQESEVEIRTVTLDGLPYEL
ncbi:MAG: hypothetical protein JKX78_03840 [Alteromonadaceae bacterium]|nr:hypothetical protein [Alteromonadaceae bacterium]MBL4909019.1 hypothetical protein [Alteromonadaceae bacterium]MBL4909085.1 hypothetical protein [Alteromonadaceae bacterium]MBL4909151.1 hypothetical protein [Alteromonadaceae bacterium]